MWSPIENNRFMEIDSMGKKLSLVLRCPVRYCAYPYDKPIFECKHMIPFPVYVVSIAMNTGDWKIIEDTHNQGYTPA